MKRTTIFAEEYILEALRDVARKEQVSLSSAVREALVEYVGRRRTTGTAPSFVGIGRSGRKDVAERADELLWTASRVARKR